MGNDVNIGAKISIDTGTSAQSINEMQAEIKKLTSELKGAKIGSDEYKAASDKLKVAQENLTKSTAEHSSTFEKLKEQLKGTVPGFEGATSGASALGKQFLALLANPIVLMVAALVGGLKFLYDSFTNTAAGGKLVKQIFAGISAVVTLVKDRVFEFGRALGKLFTGDFSGFIADSKKAFEGIGDQIKKTYDQTTKLTKELQEIAKEERKAEEDKAARATAQAKLRETINDETISLKERQKAAKELREEERKAAEVDMDLMKRKTSAKITLLSQEHDGAKKNAEEIHELNMEKQRQETSLIMEGVRTNKVIRNLDHQEKQKDHEAASKAREQHKKEIEDLRLYENKLLKIKQEEELSLITDSYLKEKKVIENKLADDKRANALMLEEGKINHAKMNTLNLEATKLANDQLLDLKAKHDKEIKLQDIEFQKELNTIESATRLEGITDIRKKELIGLADTYAQKRTAIINKEHQSAEHRNKLLEALRIEEEQQKAMLDKKYFNEDRAKAISNTKLLLKSEYDLKVAQNKATYTMELEYFDKNRDLERQELVAKKASILELTAFDTEKTAERIRIAETEATAKNGFYKGIGAAMNALGAIVGQQTSAGKALAVAQATINTWLGVTEVLRAKSVLPEPLATASKIANISATVSAGIGAIKGITSVPVPGGGGGGGGSISASAPIRPQSRANSETRLDSESIQNIGNATANRAFVVESDIRNNQERITRINRAARIH